MHPAFSVIFLTTLIGVGQGFFLALVTAEIYSAMELLPEQTPGFYALGSAIALAFLIAGLVASFFHLGHPERAWRSAAMWRTSWLSREVIVLPSMMGLVFLYGVFHFFGWDHDLLGTGLPGQLTLAIGAVGTVMAFTLYLSTAMIYASVRFLQEWATPLTVLNYTLLGAASGFTLASAYGALSGPSLARFYAGWAMVLTVAALCVRAASLIRNQRLRPKSTIQTAIGVRHTKVVQTSMGMMGGSFNTREYFSGATLGFLKTVKWLFLLLVFLLPIALLYGGYADAAVGLLALAFVVQYAGLLLERWFFFAEANHPQNLYYQTI